MLITKIYIKYFLKIAIIIIQINYFKKMNNNFKIIKYKHQLNLNKKYFIKNNIKYFEVVK